MDIDSQKTSGKTGNAALYAVCALLVVCTLVAYEPLRQSDFIMLDDNIYVTENENVNGGITPDSVVWAFTQSHAANWHPLTWLSHMLDCELFGLNAFGHHTVNLLLHIANTLLLFLILDGMTGARWRSAFVAGLFALHPMHVESVAWIAERKDVLSTLFWMLTMAFYVRYAAKPSIRRYIAVFAALFLGLMAKPMLVTLPFVLLLLDYWPLGRLAKAKEEVEQADISDSQRIEHRYAQASPRRLVVEKIPLFILALASSIVTVIAQSRDKAVVGLERWSLGVRLVNSIGAYWSYIVKLAFPRDLAVLYPAPEKMHIDSALLAVMCVVILLILWGRRRRWLIVGLLWFIGTLVPVIGFVQVGAQIMADRYTYIPSIGIFIVVVWAVAELSKRISFRPTLASLAAAALIVTLTGLTRMQVGYWRDSVTLFGHTLDVTDNNFIIHNSYGVCLSKEQHYDEAFEHFKEALRIYPEHTNARINLCKAYLNRDKPDEAIQCLTEALAERNDWPDIHEMYNDLGWAYQLKGNYEMAEANYRIALRIEPNYALAQANLVSVLREQGKIDSENPNE